jgi:hypothetical protein
MVYGSPRRLGKPYPFEFPFKRRNDDQANLPVSLIVIEFADLRGSTKTKSLRSSGSRLRRGSVRRRRRRSRVPIGRRGIVVLHRHRAGAGVCRCAAARSTGGAGNIASLIAVRAASRVAAGEACVAPTATGVRVAPTAAAAAAAMSAARFRIRCAQHQAECSGNQGRQNQ